MTSTTYGFGQLILAALEHGATEFNLCIGGSATTDGGCGMAAALGVRFSDNKGNQFIPSGGTLKEITRIDTGGIEKRIQNSKFTVMCDVDNPLFGTNGAAYVYSPQKGANPEQVLALDEGLRHYGALLFECFGRDFASVPGAGAAGGLGAGCMAYLNANLMSGIDAILKICDFEKQLSNADLIITGEGKLDSQSLQGKVLSGILRDAKGVPVLSICGILECDKELLDKHDLKVFETREGTTIGESMSKPAEYLKIAARKAMQYVREKER